jgi:hypothetical protein
VCVEHGSMFGPREVLFVQFFYFDPFIKQFSQIHLGKQFSYLHSGKGASIAPLLYTWTRTCHNGLQGTNLIDAHHVYTSLDGALRAIPLLPAFSSSSSISLSPSSFFFNNYHSPPKVISITPRITKTLISLVNP